MAKQNFVPQFIRASINPKSIDLERRTVEVIWGTDQNVSRRTWNGRYTEILSFEPGHVRMKRLESGRAPLFDNHNYWSGTRSAIGVVESAKIENGRGTAVIRFSKREEVEVIWQDVVDGIHRNISVGYDVFTYEHTENAEGPDVYRATDWEPKELSIAPLAADDDAYIRSGKPSHDWEVNIIHNKNTRSMADDNNAKPNGPESPAVDVNVDIIRKEDEPKPKPEVVAATRKEDEPKPKPEVVESTDDVRAIAQEAATAAINAERTRSNEIITIVRTGQLPDSLATDLIEKGTSVAEARKIVLDKWAANAPEIRSNHSFQLGTDETDKMRSGVQIALEHRCGKLLDAKGKPTNELPEEARKYRSMSLLDIAKMTLESRGVKTQGLTKFEIAQKALIGDGRAGGMGTGDFPIILGNTTNRVLQRAYQLAPRTFLPFCRQVNHTDFKERTVAQLSGMTTGLDEIQEGGEYKSASVTESAEKYKIAKFGKLLNLSWEMIINDDLGAFDRLATAMANQAAQKQSNIVWAIITGNPTMHDNKALFHADHGNLGTAAALAEGPLSKARAAMRKQKDPNNKDFLNIMASYLLVGPDQETEAQKILTAITANASNDVNVFSNAYTLIVEPRLTGNQWYLSAMPNTVDTIEYGFLDGQELATDQRQGFEVDGLQMKIRMTFGAKAIDWRGLYKNAGA